MTSLPRRSSIRAPSRFATSRTRSFSRKPSGPTVPVSWPPCPGSRTIRPTFRPSTRIIDRPPAELRFAGSAVSGTETGTADGAGDRGALSRVVIGAGGGAPIELLGKFGASLDAKLDDAARFDVLAKTLGG